MIERLNQKYLKIQVERFGFEMWISEDVMDNS